MDWSMLVANSILSVTVGDSFTDTHLTVQCTYIRVCTVCMYVRVSMYSMYVRVCTYDMYNQPNDKRYFSCLNLFEEL